MIAESLGRAVLRVGGVPFTTFDNISLPTGMGVWDVGTGSTGEVVRASLRKEPKQFTVGMHLEMVRQLMAQSVDNTLSGLGFVDYAYQPFDGPMQGRILLYTVAMNDADISLAKDTGNTTVEVTCNVIKMRVQ